jgi:4-carboxymuconolactone decarboxylase
MWIRGSLRRTMDTARPITAEQLLRGLAAGDESLLRSVLAASPVNAGSSLVAPRRKLSEETRALIQLTALLAAGACTTSLRWAAELASRSGADDDQIVEVLVTAAAIVGGARVVAEAPRLALAIGYDIEVEGWDGD